MLVINMYKNYIFDLYGTLIDINTDESKISFWKKISEFFSYNNAHYTYKELKEFYLIYCKEEEKILQKKYQYNSYEIQIENVFKKLYLHKNVKPSKELIKSTCQIFRLLSTKFIKLYPGVIELLETLKKNNKKIYLLSNAQYEFTIYEMISLDLVKFFDGIMISSCEKTKKPDYHFFNKLFKKYKLKKEESIMIGNDSTSDIQGANNFGIDSLYIYSDISPKNDYKNNISCKYKILDGDFKKIKDLVLKK